MSDDLQKEIARLREAEKALQESEEKYRTLIESLPHGVAIIRHGKAVFVNRALVKMLGAEDSDGVIGLEAAVPIHEDDRPRVIALLTDLVQGQIKGPIRYRHRTKRVTGEEFHSEIFADLIRFQGDKALQIVVVDETDRLRAEEEQRSLQDQMRQMQKLESLGLMAGGIAHDFNNLLMTILGNANLAAMDLPAGSKAQGNLQRIETAAQRAAELIQQMLAYSGQGSLEVRSFHLGDLVREMGQLLRSVVQRRIKLIYDFADEVPAVVGDPSQIRQIVMNLITNAAEAIGKSVGEITLRTRSVGQEPLDFDSTVLPPPTDRNPALGWVLLEVHDTGSGIGPKDMQRIFDPFFSTKFTGRGLGLAAVLGIVRGHAGALWVESEPGKGALFRLALPGAPPRVDEEEEAGRSKDITDGVGILVIEDEQEVAATFQEALSHFGHHCWLAADGREALERLDQLGQEVELVLLDLTMPGLSGAQLIEEIRTRRPELKIVLTSGYAEEEALAQLGQNMGLPFVHKPASLVELKRAVDQVIKSE